MDRKTLLEMLLELVAFVCASFIFVFLVVLMTYSMTGKEVKITDITGSLTDYIIAFANVVIAYYAAKGINHWVKPERLKFFIEKQGEIKSLCNEIRAIWFEHKFKYYEEYDAGWICKEWSFSEPNRLEFVNKIDVLHKKLEFLRKMKFLDASVFDVDKMRQEYDLFYNHCMDNDNPSASLAMEPTRLLSEIESCLENTLSTILRGG